MNLPSKVKILGFTYNIIYTKDKNLLALDHAISLGLANYRQQEITIDLGLPYEQIIQTLIHEIIHVIEHATVNQMNEYKPMSEFQTDIIATGLASILFNNNFVRFDLTDDAKEVFINEQARQE